jgi:predicted metal-dependent HD superfamily phosphohydrolase
VDEPDTPTQRPAPPVGGLARPPRPLDDPRRAAVLLDARWRRRLPDLPQVGAALLARYQDNRRCYHDVRHLADVVVRLDRLRGARPHSDTVELAAWFHDAVYGFDGGDDERRSADLARRMLADHGLEPDVVAETARLVLLTRDHVVAAHDHDGALLCDADLGVLAVDAAAYDDYAARVRREYADVDDLAFSTGRRAVLERLLDRPALFASAHARSWEAPARANIARELSRLAG